MRALACALLLGITAGAAAAQDDPVFWPEEQRAFLQDGPGLLLSEMQRRDLLARDEAGRAAWIERFLADPIPKTPENELREGIERRRRLAFHELPSLFDARAQVLFLLGPAADRKVLDCGVFRPLEIWTYGAGPQPLRLVLYKPGPLEPFRLWAPIDSKRALYTEEMAHWLRQWQDLRKSGQRLDRRLCPDSAEVDQVTGTDGLRPIAAESGPGVLLGFPEERVRRLARPADLADWAREAAGTPLPDQPLALEVRLFDLDFPGRSGQRLLARGLVVLKPPAAAPDEKLKLIVEGLVEQDGRTFEDFRMRYQLAPPTDGSPLALLFERPLRPGVPFLLRLRIRDETSGAEARVARAFRVPSSPQVRLAAAATSQARRGQELAPVLAGKDALLLVPPVDEVVLGTWRAETLVNGERIVKVVFKVDGEAQLTRTRAPYSAEVRLAPFPREQVVRAEGYDAEDKLVVADEVVVNQTRGAFRVLIPDPLPAGARLGKRVRVRAEVAVPDDRRVEAVEIRVNDQLVATLASPPWQADVDVPDEPIVHLSVAAQLDDGRRVEEVRFLRAPDNLEQVQVNLVELYVTVTDGSGGLVRGLTRDDFEILEEGRPQAIGRFELVENLPLTLGFAVDTSTSMASSLIEAQRAADGFLRKLTARDRAFAVGFSGRPYLAMPPTDDLEAVSQALEGLRAVGRTALYDGLITSLYYFRGFPGQRALILLSDGEDTGSSTSWEKAFDYARRAGVAIFPVGLNVGALKLEVRGQLSALAEATGGRAFFIERAEELATVYGEIERELRSRYLVAYSSDKPSDEYGFRKIDVKVKRGGKVRVSRGYLP